MRELNAMEDFRRDVTYEVKVLPDQSIRLTGVIRDRYHDIHVEVRVDAETLVIRQGQVRFDRAPSPHCRCVEERMEKLVGTEIGRGLSRRLNEAFGSRSGCGNLRTLLMGLLPLALNVKACAGIDDEQEMLDAIHHKLQGTCAGYPAVDTPAESSGD